MSGPDPLADDLLEGLDALSLDEVRARRAACQDVEAGLSYVRRLAQGRLDIVLHELAVRAGTAEHSDDLVASLTVALADRITAPGLGHLPTSMSPEQVDPELLRRLDEVADPAGLTEPQKVGEDDLRSAAAGLQAYERELSERRRALFDRIDALQGEIIKRYRDGSASVDTLLQG